jgi:hypothetical protein
MIPLGKISIRGERGEERMSRLTRDEQYTLMTLFTIFKSPLMFGGDLPVMDPFTLSLLTNRAVLKMHREGSQVRQIMNSDSKVVLYSKNENTGEIYLALFNISDDEAPKEIVIDLADLNCKGEFTLTDLWNGQDAGTISGTFRRHIKPHASGLYSLKPVRP